MNNYKKTIKSTWIGFAALAIMGMANPAAAASLTFGTTGANSGQAGVRVDVDLEVDGGEEIASLQLDLQYDGRLILVDILAGNAATTADKSVAWNSQSSGAARVLLYGLNKNVLGNGAVLQLIFDVKSDAASGRAIISGDKVKAASPAGTSAALTANGGYVKIAGGGLPASLLIFLLTGE